MLKKYNEKYDKKCNVKKIWCSLSKNSVNNNAFFPKIVLINECENICIYHVSHMH